MLRSLRSSWRVIRRRLGLGARGARGLARRHAALERDAARLLRRAFPGLDASPSGLPSFHEREFALHSQNGEDGLLLHILSVVGAPTRRLVEFGVEDGRECLARTLVEHFGWSGLLMDGDARNVADARRFWHGELGVEPSRLAIRECFVTAENIDAVLVEAGMAGELDLLSIDIDGNDYWVWKAISAVRPRVVAIEYNASFGPDEDLVVAYDPAFDRKAKHASGWYHGASLAALVRLAARRGFALVGCDSAGVNAFFVRRDLVAEALPEMTVDEAFRPHRSRGRRATAAEQLALLRTLPVVSDGE